ncbi:hypothetical protein DL771_004286 [Monosporascus sp. 5C6A]|nr:hypothetical protein DL771_004286 [Monosporascus sp. 5C6A]
MPGRPRLGLYEAKCALIEWRTIISMTSRGLLSALVHGAESLLQPTANQCHGAMAKMKERRGRPARPCSRRRRACLLGAASAFTNPVRRPGGSDPFIAYSGDGYYYMMSTSWTNLQIARSKTIEGLKTAPKKVVYSTNEPRRCYNVWAPEVHYLDGNWYIYYTAGNASNLDGQNLHVLKGGPSAWDEYTYAGQLTNPWSIDRSVIRFNGWGNYLAYSCFHGVRYQSTCLQKLGDDNVSLTGPISVISQPTESWERSGMPVQEGPVALYYGGKTYIVYSANYCWTPDYCLATLEWDGRTNPLRPGAWKKPNDRVFSQANGHYGTGHNSFFQSPDGS